MIVEYINVLLGFNHKQPEALEMYFLFVAVWEEQQASEDFLGLSD